MSRRRNRSVVILGVFLAVPFLAVPRAIRAEETGERPVLELSLDEAVERALKNNTDLAVERFNPESAVEEVRLAEGAYDPLLVGQLNKNSSDTPAQSAFSGAEKVTTKTWNWNFGASQLLKTGATWNLSFRNDKSDTNNIFTTFNPSYSSTLNLSLTQPLLRDFMIDASREQLRVSKNNREISDVQFRQTVINTIANVKKAYYNIIAGIDNLSAQQKSLALARKLLDENQIKVRVGTLAPLDVVEAESEVAGREGDVIVAETLLAQLEDILKFAISPKYDPAFWNFRIVPKDRPTAESVPVDVEAAVKNALEKRTDLVAARKALDNNDLAVRLAKNQVLPRVDFVGAYGTAGLGGTQLIRDGFGGPIIDTVPGGYGDALDAVFGRDFPTWTVGVNVTYPLFNRRASASAAQARLAKDQAIAALNRLELQVAQDVRNAGRNVESNFKRVESTRAARVLQERRLDAEEKKFAAGMSTNFLVTQAQRDLATAEVNDITAVLDYRNSLIEFERVQEAGVGAGSGVILSTAVSSGATASSLSQLSQAQATTGQ
jgi:outer membrane protein TolC